MSIQTITLCGSMRFAAQMAREALRLELERGCLVLTPTLPAPDTILTPEAAARLAVLHLRRIDLADAVYIVNPGGYIGETTQKEIAYAREKGKDIIYMEA